jgi:hypothetical protein
MFRILKKTAEVLGAKHIRKKPRPLADSPVGPFEQLPFIDNETLDHFLSEPANVELLPVDPHEYRPEIQRMIVSAFFHEASMRAKRVEMV